MYVIITNYFYFLTPLQIYYTIGTRRLYLDFTKIREKCWKFHFVQVENGTWKEKTWCQGTLIGHCGLWSYNWWIYIYICHQCLSPLILWICFPHAPKARCTQYNFMWQNICQLLVAGCCFFLGTLVSSTNKSDCDDRNVALNTNNLTHLPMKI